MTTYAEAEVIALAVKSLKIFGKDIRIRISDVALFSEIFENLKLAEHVKPFVLKLFETKNSAGLNILVKDKRIDVSTAERLKKFLNIYLPFEEGVKLLGSDEFVKILSNENKAAKHLKELITGLNAEFSGKNIVFLGDGVPVYKHIINEKLETTHFYAPSNISKQRAGSVAVLGKMYYNRNIIETAKDHEPVYLRLSQAERERNEKQLENRE